MQIEITVNLGNYENIKVRSSEFESPEYCFEEIRDTLTPINELRVNDFIKKYIDKPIKHFNKDGRYADDNHAPGFDEFDGSGTYE